MARSGTLDRIVVASVGLAALASGSYGLARSLGAFGVAQRDSVLLGADLRQSAVDHAGWLSGVATFVALVGAWLGWRWLRRQLVGPSSSTGRIRLVDGAGGHTSVEARALADAVVRDLEAEPQVRTARARVVGHERAPELELTVDLTATADTTAVRRHVEDHVLVRARAALERDVLEARLRLRLGDPSSRVLD